jgi:hydrogenase maturation protease
MIVACEPLTFCGNEGAMGLSEPVAVAVNAAITTVEDLADELLEGKVLS